MLVQSKPEVEPRPGALRYVDALGEMHVANPHDLTYSTVSMLAREFWDGEQWVPVDAA